MLLLAASEATNPTTTEVGVWMLILFMVIMAADRIKSLLSKPADKEATPKGEFETLRKAVETDHDKLSQLVQYKEFRETVDAMMKQSAATTERIADVRIGMEEQYRALNKDMQDLVGRMVERLENSQRHLMTHAASKMPRQRADKDVE